MPPSDPLASDNHAGDFMLRNGPFPEIGAKCKIRQALPQAPLRKGLARVFDVHTTGEQEMYKR